MTKAIKTSDAGFYSVDALTPNLYTMTAVMQGFSANSVQHVQVSLGQTRETSFSLKVSSTGETISVTAGALAVEPRIRVQGTDYVQPG